MSVERIRVGIVGAGANTKAKHIPGLRAQPGVDIVSVCNRSDASSKAVAAEFGIPRTAASWQELVADPDVDAVMIGTWPYLHAPVTLAALAEGKHVLCEARMAMDLTEARRMLEASQSRPELTAMVVPNPFTLRWDKTIRRLLRENVLGGLVQVDVTASPSGFINFDRPMTWREDRALSGLNTMSLGIMYEAVMRWTGPATVRAARANITVPHRKDGNGELRKIEVPDHLDILADYPNGAGLHIRISQVAPSPPGTDTFVLYGTHGRIRLNLDTNALWLATTEAGEREVIPAEEEAGDWRVEEEFINAIRGVEPVTHTTFADGVKYMEFTEAVAKAAGYK